MIFYYNSSQIGAPALPGTAGSLKTLLQACSSTGFGAGSATGITVASGVATVSFSGAHPYIVDGPIAVAGATPAALNGNKTVTAITTDSVQFAAPGAPDGAATGAITTKVPGAGWQEMFAGTANLLVLKPSVPEATGSVLRLDDSGTNTARVIGFESMSGVSTGLGPSPTDAQISGGGHWPKSATADATARAWFVVADPRGVLFGVAPNGGGRYTLRWWGDIASLRAGDAWSALLTCDLTNQAALAGVPDGCVAYSGRTASRAGAYLQRSYTGLGGSVQALRIGAHQTGSAADAWAGSGGYSLGNHPNGPNNGLLLCPLEIWEGGHQRGTVPGLWHPYLNCGEAFSTGDIVVGTDDLAGRRLMAVRTAGPGLSALLGTVFIDLTGPWAR